MSTDTICQNEAVFTQIPSSIYTNILEVAKGDSFESICALFTVFTTLIDWKRGHSLNDGICKQSRCLSRPPRSYGGHDLRDQEVLVLVSLHPHDHPLVEVGRRRGGYQGLPELELLVVLGKKVLLQVQLGGRGDALGEPANQKYRVHKTDRHDEAVSSHS